MPRFTIDIDQQFSDTLDRLANGGSKADVIRRAVQTYSYLKSEVPNNEVGKRVSITNNDSVIEKDIILP
jgi:metal-responsive CopG/Arc/MetJ family transcriptional regulator